jgi:hypothetical protein
MSTYNNQTEYELMELLGLKDLENAQLVLAYIVLLNRGTKTAEISITEECEVLEGKDLTEVPFFYHCEFSKGTIEDLEYGHLAFNIGEMVYVLYVPENGDQVEQLYIVGHYDIRKTKLCYPSEYLVIQFAFTLNQTYYNYLTIYDATNNCKLNLGAFENLDENSPAKPASLPNTDTNIAAWLAYNFNVDTTFPTTSGTFHGGSGKPNIFFDWTGFTHTEEYTPYSGQLYNLCNDFDLGNGRYEETDIYAEYYEGFYPPEYVDYYLKWSSKNSGATKYELGDTYCRVYWKGLSSDYVYTVDAITSHDEIKIYSKGQYWYATFKVEWNVESHLTGTLTGDTTEIESTAFSYNTFFTMRSYYDYGAMGRSFVINNERTYSGHLTFNIPTVPNWSSTPAAVTVDSYYSSTQADGAYPFAVGGLLDMSDNLCNIAWYDTMEDFSHGVRQGKQNIYILTGGLSLEQWGVTSQHLTATYVGTAPYPYNVTAGFNSAGLTSYRYKFVGLSDVCVAPITSLEVNMSGYYDLIDVVHNASESMSLTLNSVINEMYAYIQEIHDPVTESDTYDLLMEISKGPTCTIYNKKFL